MLATEPDPMVSSQEWMETFGSAPSAEQRARIAAASRSVRQFCGWHVSPVVEQTFTVDGTSGRVLHLPTLRLVDVTAISNDGVDVDLDDVEWSHDGYLYGSWSRKLRGVQVTIEHGFDSVPDLLMLVLELASRAAPGGVVQRQAGQVSVRYSDPGLMQHERDQLALYRLPTLA